MYWKQDIKYEMHLYRMCADINGCFLQQPNNLRKCLERSLGRGQKNRLPKKVEGGSELKNKRWTYTVRQKQTNKQTPNTHGNKTDYVE